MGLFRQRIDSIPPQTGQPLGATIRIPLERDFPREGLVVTVEGTLTAAAATGVTLGMYEVVKRVRLLANDGGTQRSIVDCWGPALPLRHLHNNQMLPTDEVATQVIGAKKVTFPIMFPPAVLNSPTYDMFLQNFPRFNSNPVLEIQLATQADLDVNAAPTLACAAGFTVRVLDIKREISIANFNFLNTELTTAEVPHTAAGSQFEYLMPVPGYHFYTGVVSFASAGILGDITDGNPMRFDILNTSLRNIRFVDQSRLNAFGDSLRSIESPAAVAMGNVAWFDWLTDQTGSDVVNLDTLMNTYPFNAVGTAPKIKYGIGAPGATAKLLFIQERCFGDISAALALARLNQ